jgi:preprotein translocase subunit SecY
MLRGQIINLRRRLYLIRWMQAFAIGSFLSCFMCMFLLFLEKMVAANWAFGGSLLLMIVSLVLSFMEITLSTGALKLLLKDFEKK